MYKLSPILEKLAEKMPVDRVYKFVYPFLGVVQQRLLVVIDSKCQASAKTLEPMADLCLAETPQYSYGLIPFGELKTAINNGALYYVLVCRNQHLAMVKGQKPLPVPAGRQLESICSKAQEHYEKAKAKQVDFLEGMEFYRSKGNFSQALFMLHQATELTFRGIENAIFKRDRPSHNLQEHLSLMAKYIPELGFLFNKEDSYAYRLLKLVNQSYTAVRYQRTFEVEEEELNNLHNKLMPILTWCNDYYNHCMGELEALIIAKEKQPETVNITAPQVANKAKVINLPESLTAQLNTSQLQELKNILGNLIFTHPLAEIRLLGYETSSSQKSNLYHIPAKADQTAQCYLLAIHTKGHHARSHTITHRHMRVTVLMIAENQANHAVEKKNRFVIQALGETKLIYRTNDGIIAHSSSELDWPQVLEKAKSVWAYRHGQAKKFYESALWANREGDAQNAALLLLSQAIEQVCLGFTYTCMGYQSDNMHLPFLFDVCKLIAPELSACFQSYTELDKKLMPLLYNSLPSIRYKKGVELRYDDIDYLIQRSKKFIDLADKLCQRELTRLEKFAQKEKVVETTQSTDTRVDILLA